MSDSQEVPISIQDAMRARLARRTSVAQQLIEVVSVVPGGAEIRLIEAVDPSLIKAIEEAEASGLVSVDAAIGCVPWGRKPLMSGLETSYVVAETKPKTGVTDG